MLIRIEFASSGGQSKMRRTIAVADMNLEWPLHEEDR